MGNALEIRGLMKRYRKRVALDGLSMNVPSGSLFGLIGSNGAGKTTTLSIVTGLLRSSGGDINVLGSGPFDPLIHTGRVSLMPQDSDHPRESRVIDLLVFYAELQGLSRKEAVASAESALDFVNLSDRKISTIKSLSHGMKRRVVIAQAFLGNPELILLDEPLSGLDPKEVVNIRNLLQTWKGRQTIVISSHNLHEIERICDEVAFIEDGKMVCQDSVESMTGKSHTVTYKVSGKDVPLAILEEKLPYAEFSLSGDGLVLTCKCSAGQSITHANSKVLRCLLDSDVEIVELRQGSELESAYMNHHST